jgi:hypothetical protein
MSVARTVVLASFLAAPPAAAAQEAAPLRIVHQPPQCLVPNRYPELRARIEPIANVLRARILFRTDPLAEPHAVTMTQDGQEFVGVLPRPLPSLGQITYWIDAADPALLEVASDEVTVPIQGGCAQPARTRKSARTDVTAPIGAALVPEGFAPDQAMAENEPRGSGRPGVFNLGPATSLIAALAVGGGAVALAANRNPAEEPPNRVPDMEPPGIRFIDSVPAVGGTVRLGAEGLQLTVRVVVDRNSFGGSPNIEFRQNPGGPVCMTQAFTLPNEFLEPHIGRNVQFRTFRSTGACGATFDVNVVRVSLNNIQGQVIFGTGTADIPDLQLHYRVTP